MITENFFNNDGSRNLDYLKNFKTHKYVKFVSFTGYQQNYIEAFASNNKDSNIDAEVLVEEISPTAKIKNIFVFEIKDLVGAETTKPDVKRSDDLRN